MQQLELLEAPPTTRLRFGCAYFDPPWEEKGGGGRGVKYPTMSADEICRLPVERVMLENAHLWLWATANYLRAAMTVGEAWGFRYVTNRVWDKQIAGTGQYVRMEHEHLLLFVRGHPPVPAPPHRESSIIRWKRTRKHSEKPPLHQYLERVSPGPWLEGFAREAAPGWTVCGNQAPGDGGDIATALWRLYDGKAAARIVA